MHSILELACFLFFPSLHGTRFIKQLYVFFVFFILFLLFLIFHGVVACEAKGDICAVLSASQKYNVCVFCFVVGSLYLGRCFGSYPLLLIFSKGVIVFILFLSCGGRIPSWSTSITFSILTPFCFCLWWWGLAQHFCRGAHIPHQRLKKCTVRYLYFFYLFIVTGVMARVV